MSEFRVDDDQDYRQEIWVPMTSVMIVEIHSEVEREAQR